MPRYRIMDRETRERYEVEAPFAQDACEQLGWMIGHCYVEMLREGPFSGMSQAPLRLESEHDGRTGDQ